MVTYGAKFPPVVVFDDGSVKWLADGFHRVHSTRKVGYEAIEAVIHQGTVRDAQWYSLGANKDNGLHRSPGDKKKAIETALKDPEWSKKFNQSEIARHIGVSQQYVSKIADSHLQPVVCDKPKTTYTDKHGNVSTMNTANIGRKKGGAASVVCEANMPITDGDEGDGDDCGCAGVC